MDITFQTIMPIPLASIQHQKDSIWGNDFVLTQGKKILLNASSGKGKSTFTNLILGLRKDYDGKLLYNKQDTSQFTSDEWTSIRQKDIAVVFQDLQLFPSLTVKENLQLKSNLTGTFNDNELLEMLKTLEIEDKWNQPCGLLSMGQQQRVAIIRALSQPFKWLILDEPFSHLDEENTQRSLKLINERCDQLQAGFVLTSLGDSHQFNYDQELKL
ncbi:MAG: ATP-binding cassette domain-containing protein [Crocinitomicaceae bacterium]|nr:ATP-binding cassette domain-containing protein [Crocinitomicaceae bacterium]